MDEATRQRCLEPFFTTKGERGTGLGLAMVYGVVQRHSADIEIDSATGRGTTVRLSFSVPVAIAVEPESRASAFPTSCLRILLVDDDPILLQSLQDTLQADGHDVTSANGGEAGIELFRAASASGSPFAVVVSDLGMPHVDGRRVAAAVKEISPSTPVILLTGWGQRLIGDGDVPMQVDRVLAKPPRMRELREALAYLCKGA
jgi:CheY-like chemotaxis protein